MFDIIYDKGIFAFRSGYNCAQTCSDAALAHYGFKRDEAEQLPEIASGMVGINIDNPNGKVVFDLWREGQRAGLFKTNRQHDLADSADPRFLHGRQDQSILSLAIHKAGLYVNDADYCAYYKTGYDPEKLHFWIGGL